MAPYSFLVTWRGAQIDPEATFEIAIGNRPLPGVEQTLWQLGGAQS
jgi:hypothetical protein